MATAYVAPFFDRINSFTTTFVTDISSNTIATLTPIVSVGLMLAFLLFGVLIMNGVVRAPIGEFLKKSLEIGLIVSIATAGGLYQTHIAGGIVGLGNDLANSVVGSGGNLGNVIDNAIDQGAQKFNEAWERSNLWTDGGRYLIVGAIILAYTLVIGIIGGSIVATAYVFINVLVAVGPAFIYALLFAPTRQMFTAWVGQAMNFTILLPLFALICAFVMGVFGEVMSQLQFDGLMNVAKAIVFIGIVIGISAVIMYKTPAVASALAGGISIGFAREVQQMRRGASAAADTTVRATKATVGGTHAAARTTVRAAKVVTGHFRGKKAA